MENQNYFIIRYKLFLTLFSSLLCSSLELCVNCFEREPDYSLKRDCANRLFHAELAGGAEIGEN